MWAIRALLFDSEGKTWNLFGSRDFFHLFLPKLSYHYTLLTNFIQSKPGLVRKLTWIWLSKQHTSKLNYKICCLSMPFMTQRAIFWPASPIGWTASIPKPLQTNVLTYYDVAIGYRVQYCAHMLVKLLRYNHAPYAFTAKWHSLTTHAMAGVFDTFWTFQKVLFTLFTGTAAKHDQSNKGRRVLLTPSRSFTSESKKKKRGGAYMPISLTGCHSVYFDAAPDPGALKSITLKY